MPHGYGPGGGPGNASSAFRNLPPSGAWRASEYEAIKPPKTSMIKSVFVKANECQPQLPSANVLRHAQDNLPNNQPSFASGAERQAINGRGARPTRVVMLTPEQAQSAITASVTTRRDRIQRSRSRAPQNRPLPRRRTPGGPPAPRPQLDTSVDSPQQRSPRVLRWVTLSDGRHIQVPSPRSNAERVLYSVIRRLRR